MEHCTQCGHQLGVGRYCTNCGHPVGAAEPAWRTDTAERPTLPAAPEPEAPPAAWTSPPPARFPLFADQADDLDVLDDLLEYDEPVAVDEPGPVTASQH